MHHQPVPAKGPRPDHIMHCKPAVHCKDIMYQSCHYSDDAINWWPDVLRPFMQHPHPAIQQVLTL